MDIEHIEPVIEIAAQLARSNRIVRNFVRSGKYAHIYGRFHFTSQAAELVVFENTQQLRLCAHWHLADFIEQQRAPFGQFEASSAPLQSSCEGALFVAKDLAFNQRLRNRCAVDGDERPVAAWA